MDTLPVELYYSIAQHISDLFTLRAVNRFFSSLVTPLAFRHLVLTSRIKSGEGFRKIRESALLSGYVQVLSLVFLQEDESVAEAQWSSLSKCKDIMHTYLPQPTP